MDRRNINIFQTGFLLFCIVSYLAGCTSATDRISKLVDGQNRQLPKMLTPEMRIDSMVFFVETNTLKYYYTVLNDSVVLDYDYPEAQRTIAGEIKKYRPMTVFRDQKMTFEYIYVSDRSRKILLNVVIPESMYK
jgi:hypothetical protein